MGLERGEGFVLRTREFAEADIIVTLFLRGYGKRTAIAKGARRLNSRLGGVFDLLNRVEIVFYPRDRLDLVSQGTLLDGYDSLKRDLTVVNSALSVARLLDRLLPPHQEEAAPYRLFERFLSELAKGRSDKLRIAVELKLLSLLGHRPHLRACLRCGDRKGPFRFLPTRGGLLCRSCAGEEGIPVETGLARALDWLLYRPIEKSGVVSLSEEETKQADALLKEYVDLLSRGT